MLRILSNRGNNSSTFSDMNAAEASYLKMPLCLIAIIFKVALVFESVLAVEYVWESLIKMKAHNECPTMKYMLKF